MTKKQLADLALAKNLIKKYETQIAKCHANSAPTMASQYERLLKTTRQWVANMEGN